ncbi:twin-arginine translocase TatA/TatE family subunit [Corynebacterium sp. 320]|uniref:Sec-independent protein translocase subunit TatA n=1 Tax=Corynebacterium TaxID=1716 RepID=UPI00125CC3D1|nr:MULTISPECIES: Sec-independent protein translocase subunit TatA [Corynebacterium]KAB1503623.1 twin-arginine translocase TatA/TatE family subunit [Corynebacterium sp. 320]KAB1553276.1 twin-arginine translocase TatA/TatE family subunit [Corynebacterium sp. 321]KAB1553505.1 twin-arginine translocase TatA/TatE family subunit [Corynebacterium sp. 319]KAB3527759.1 twin-arginine translocase TatA/TatE family subunit [Corynebacterium sp. 250]KAB3540752.1 twin-arginine translocase TatA/TatE family sub
MSLGPWEIILILLVIFLLFGATRLPNAARSLGRSMRIFKSEMDEMKNDKNAANSTPNNQAITDQAAQAPQSPQEQQLNQQAQPQVDPQVAPQPEAQNVNKPEGDAR